MKTETTKTEQCRTTLTVTLDASETVEATKAAEKRLMRVARIPGFRPGKVPLALIRKNFAAELEQEKAQALLNSKLYESAKQAGLDVVNFVEIKNLKCDDNGGEITAVVDVRPVFKLPDVKGLKIGKKDVQVKDDEVEAVIDRARVAAASYVDAKEGDALAEGDFAQIDYSGTIKGKPIAEINPDAKMVASGTGFWLLAEEGRFLPELLEALKGMKPGETKEGVKAKFAKDDSAPEGLAGKEAVYTLTLKTLRRRVLPGDEEFLKSMKAESLDEIRAKVRANLQNSADAAEARRREDAAADLLLKKCTFAVPQTQVENVRDRHLEELAKRAQESGLDAEYFEKNKEKIVADAEAAAERQVRLWYILDAVAKAENIEAPDGERNRKALDFILANAK